MNKTSSTSIKFLSNRTQNRNNNQENNFKNKENNSNKWYKNKLLIKESITNTTREKLINIENKPQINTIKIMRNKNENIDNNKEENEKTEKIKTFRYKSRYKFNIIEKEDKKEIIEKNKNIDENKNKINNLLLSMNETKANRRENYRERIKAFNTYKEEDFNKEIKERKTVFFNRKKRKRNH